MAVIGSYNACLKVLPVEQQPGSERSVFRIEL
jgi:hypothetical protein